MNEYDDVPLDDTTNKEILEVLKSIDDKLKHGIIHVEARLSTWADCGILLSMLFAVSVLALLLFLGEFLK